MTYKLVDVIVKIYVTVLNDDAENYSFGEIEIKLPKDSPEKMMNERELVRIMQHNYTNLRISNMWLKHVMKVQRLWSRVKERLSWWTRVTLDTQLQFWNGEDGRMSDDEPEGVSAGQVDVELDTGR